MVSNYTNIMLEKIDRQIVDQMHCSRYGVLWCSLLTSFSVVVSVQACSICSRSLTQRSPWASSRVMGFHECNVVGVLVCGHTYHTECLEQITPDSSRQDPSCPRCSSSEKVVPKKPVVSLPPTVKAGTVRGSSFMSRPSPRNKLSRIGVLDDSVSLGKPRFSTSSTGEPSPWPFPSGASQIWDRRVACTRFHHEQVVAQISPLEFWSHGVGLSILLMLLESTGCCFHPGFLVASRESKHTCSSWMLSRFVCQVSGHSMCAHLHTGNHGWRQDFSGEMLFLEG